MTKSTAKRAVLYLRLSQSNEQSVSIDRQRRRATDYAKSKGWTVAGEFVDDGVSASKNAPEDRLGWRAMTAAADSWDVVIVWKLDRAVRRISNFWDTHRWLDDRGKALASVEENLDMTTTIGQMLAGLLAGFAQMEAEAISARVTGARAHLLANGRWPGGRAPYGWRIVDNPDGKGKVVVQDPDTIGVVKQIVERTLAGHSIHSTAKLLTEQGVPTYTGGARWAYNTVYGLLHHPLLAGLVPANPGRASAPATKDSKGRGDGVVLGDNGLPLVHEHLAVMPVGRWRAMVAHLDDPAVDPRRMPRAQRASTSGLLSGLVFCGDDSHDEPLRMWRGTKKSVKGTSYSCSGPEGCNQTLSSIDDLVVGAFLRERGDLMHLDLVEEVVEGAAAEYAEATVRLQELSGRLALASGEEFDALVAEIGGLKALQAKASALPSRVEWRQVGDGVTRTFAEDWERAGDDDEERRRVLGHALDRVVVTRGRKGEWTDASKLARMTFEWRPMGEVGTPPDKVLAAWAEDTAWRAS